MIISDESDPASASARWTNLARLPQGPSLQMRFGREKLICYEDSCILSKPSLPLKTNNLENYTKTRPYPLPSVYPRPCPVQFLRPRVASIRGRPSLSHARAVCPMVWKDRRMYVDSPFLSSHGSHAPSAQLLQLLHRQRRTHSAASSSAAPALLKTQPKSNIFDLIKPTVDLRYPFQQMACLLRLYFAEEPTAVSALARRAVPCTFATCCLWARRRK